jgi:hypothetical protein
MVEHDASGVDDLPISICELYRMQRPHHEASGILSLDDWNGQLPGSQ